MSGHEMRDTVARAICALTSPCPKHESDAGLAVVALAEAGYLHHPQTGDGAVAPGGSPPSAGAVSTAPSSPYGPEPSRDCLIVDRDGDPYRYDENAWVCLTAASCFGSWLEINREYGPFSVFDPKTGGGAGDTPPATSAVPHPAAQAGEAIGSPAPPSPHPRRFELYRHSDITGLTGTGVVAWGAEWPDGSASLRWGGKHPSTVAWANVERIIAVHGHQGSTELRWLDGDQNATPEGVSA